MKINSQSPVVTKKIDIKGKSEKSSLEQNDMVTFGSKEGKSESFLKPLSLQTANSESQAYAKGCSALVGGGALIGGGYLGGLFAGTIIGFKLQGITGAATGALIGSVLFGKLGTFAAKQFVEHM